MSLPTLHLLGIFHTIHNQEFSHCAFTGKALRFSKMMQNFGYNVIEYANEGSESAAAEKVVIMTRDEYDAILGPRAKTAFHGDKAATGTPHHSRFDAKLRTELAKRIQPRDIVCHPFGHSHSTLLQLFPGNIHVETGIGYPTTMPGSMKIFESYAWRHYHCGKDNRQGSNYEWVIPNYFDLDEWEPCYDAGEYLAFMGRIDKCKGLDTILAIAKHSNKKIVLCGQGDPAPWQHPNIEYRGPLTGRQRSDFIRRAICSLMPTNFIEPFGGSGVEGMLCGTPLIGTDYGAFTETIINETTGYRCKTLHDWLEAIDNVANLDRRTVAAIARKRYSLETCGQMYARAFRQMSELYEDGWYSLPPKWRQEKSADPVAV